MRGDIHKGGGVVIPFPVRTPSQPQNPMASLGTVACPCCAGRLATVDETMIAVNDIWLQWRKRECERCGKEVTTTEIPAELAIDALKGICHA